MTKQPESFGILLSVDTPGLCDTGQLIASYSRKGPVVAANFGEEGDDDVNQGDGRPLAHSW
jgi:hypothetical protein